MAQVKPKGKTKILDLLLELEHNDGLFAGAEESLTGMGHKPATIDLAVRFDYIEVWRTCEDTTYYQLTVKGKRKVAFEHWGPVETKQLAAFKKAIAPKKRRRAA